MTDNKETKQVAAALLLRAREVAPLLGVSRAYVYELIANGTLPRVRVGKAVRVPRRALDEWIEKQTEAGRAA